jgi:predicted transposase YbfD/YdcC
MPAASSSLIDPATGQLLAAAQSLDREHGRLLPVLAAVPDPRTRRGVRHRLAHAARAIQIVRRRRQLTGKNTKKWSTQTVCAITSLSVIQARPADLAQIARGHWGIEDRLHWVRDVIYDEDRSQVRTGNGPRVMASLRNLVTTILRLTGRTSIAAALRHHARQPSRPLQTITQC